MIPATSQLKGGIWVTGSRVLAQLLQFGVFVVAAQVLRPADFGVFALIAAVIVFLNLFATAGWSEYAMNWHGGVHRLKQTLLVAMLVGALIAALGLLSSAPLAALFGVPGAGQIAQILSLTVFFSAGAATYGGILIWQKKLATSAVCALIGEFANIAVAIPALLQGQGIAALAYGRLAGSATACLCGFLASGVRPARVRRFGLIRAILAFSWSITQSRLLMTFRAYGATLIIGGFLGPAAVGYYRAAQRVVGAFEEIVSEPVRVLAWSYFSKERKSDPSVASIGKAGLRFFPMLIYASSPVFIGIAVMAEDLTLGILGTEWLAAIPIIQVLALAALIRASGTTTVPILSIVGKVALLPRYMLIYALVSIACITVGAMNGLLATAISELVAATLVFVISARVMRRHAEIEWFTVMRYSWPVIPAILAALGVALYVNQNDLMAGFHPLMRFSGLGLAMLAVYIPVLLLFDRALIARLRTSSVS